ncbi:hypothetical protein BGW36DRAFT_429605 [Talaromyces proteolyticus]|uniref:Nephrocystin 3-like N-terminal domain-containing protein n=1 Tax=Talaromyces proteolyticus TaxID=1131652 RepID=A0AAD4KM88_9EURO|nr:uncharacterized protein BGW36DRAFT_429605 [Talaromyces proteolyticus]KAH8693560.1 hypothetical protein BGW36DRAFT_429605 [Talaromyces proteolyticus]
MADSSIQGSLASTGSEGRNITPDFCKITSGKEFHRTREPNTLDWVFSHPQLQEFRASTRNEILWFAAPAGCGKSVSTRSIIEENIFHSVDGLVCACFILKDGSKRQKPATALQALLYQMFTARPQLFNRYAADYVKQTNNGLLHDKVALWDIFKKALADPILGKEVVCIMDGLDECDDTAWLIASLMQLWFDVERSEADSRPILKIFLTSDPRVEFQILFRSTQRLREIHPSESVEEIKSDLRTLYRYRLDRLPCSSSDRLKIDERFHKLGSETANYLWFSLYWPRIEKTIISQRRAERSKLLSRIPQTLDKLYKHLLKGSQDEDTEAWMFRMVFGAVEPLTLTELNAAFAISSEATSYTNLNLKQPGQFRQYLNQLCGPLLTTIDDKVYFIHHSFRDFLCHTSSFKRHTGKFMHKISKADCHTALAEVCCRVLKPRECKNEVTNDAKRRKTSSGFQRNKQTSDDIISHNPFLRYAAINWHQHAKLSRKHGPEINEIIQDLCTPKEAGKIPRGLGILSHQRRPEMAELAAEIEKIVPRHTLSTNATTILVLYIAAWLGLHTLLKHMLSKKPPRGASANLAATLINHAPRTGYLTPLGIAAKRGHIEATKLLLLKSETEPLDPNISPQLSLQLSGDVKWNTLFHCARSVAKAADAPAISRVEKQYKGQLVTATMSGEYQYVENLLANGPDPSEFDFKDVYCAALYSSLEVDEPNTNVIVRLLEVGADANYRRDNAETILEVAALHEDPELVKMLIEAGADPNVYSGNGKHWYEHVGMKDVAREAGLRV